MARQLPVPDGARWADAPVLALMEAPSGDVYVRRADAPTLLVPYPQLLAAGLVADRRWQERPLTDTQL